MIEVTHWTLVFLYSIPGLVNILAGVLLLKRSKWFYGLNIVGAIWVAYILHLYGAYSITEDNTAMESALLLYSLPVACFIALLLTPIIARAGEHNE